MHRTKLNICFTSLSAKSAPSLTRALAPHLVLSHGADQGAGAARGGAPPRAAQLVRGRRGPAAAAAPAARQANRQAEAACARSQEASQAGESISVTHPENGSFKIMVLHLNQRKNQRNTHGKIC